MSAGSAIEELFQLASYSSSYRWKGKKPALEHVYVSQLHSSSSRTNGEGYVTVSAQADGIHILDVSTLHPLVSHTLGPSTSFSCPSITTKNDSSGAETYTTYAVIEASPELSSLDEGGRVIWKWTEQTSSVSLVKENQKKTSKTIVSAPKRIHSLYSSPELPTQIFALTTSGEFLSLDAETLDQNGTVQISEDERSDVFTAFIFSNSSPASSNAAVSVVPFLDGSDSLRLRILSFDGDHNITPLAEHRLPHNRDQISDISCSPSGCFTVLCRDGTWHAYSLPLSSRDVPVTPSRLRSLSTSIRLAKLASPTSPSRNEAPVVSILALTSSHALLASTSTSYIHIQIWDLQYSVLLASHSFPIPSAFSSAPFTLKLSPGELKCSSASSSATSTIRGQALLVISPSPLPAKGSGSGGSSQNVTSSILVVPYVVPQQSTIAAALGRGPLSKQWLKTADNQTNSSPQKKSSEEAAREKMLTTVRSSIEAGQVKAAESAFFAWLKVAEQPAKEGPENAEEGTFSKSTFGYEFVRDLLSILLPAKKPSQADYPTEILKALLERKVVSNGMVEGGLLPALRSRNDWASIELSFATVIDLAESDIIECLALVVRHHRQQHQRQQNSEDSMLVDSPSSSAIPTLSSFLALCINYPTVMTSKPLILALKQHFRDPEDVACVAQSLEAYIRHLAQQRKANGEVLLVSTKDLEKNQHGVWVVSRHWKDKKTLKSASKKATGAPPALDKVINFLQSFMDACFLSLLQHPPSHKLLQQLQKHLVEEVAFSEVLEQLRGALEPFATAQRKALREAAIPEKEKEKQRQKGDWRQRRNAAPSVVGAVGAVGVYQLEELVL